MKKRYAFTAFSGIVYFIATKRGQDHFQTYIAPSLPNQLQHFQYQTGVSPLSQWPWPVSFCIGYLLSVVLLKQYMINKEAWNLRLFRIVHNTFLCFGSFVMLLAMVKELIPVVQKGGLESLTCDSNKFQLEGNLYFWFYIFFLSKFYEFLDTYILILRKKPINFLHCYHHFITAFLCWVGLVTELSTQWVIITINALVHVFMYYYYLAQTLNTDIWWKKYLTTAQIIQFVIDLIGTSTWLYYKYGLQIECSGTVPGFLFAISVVASFLALFINFYIHTYKQKGKSE